jgi:hypothetical protein
MIDALANHSWKVILACKEVGISRQTHYNWERDYPEYRKALQVKFCEAQVKLNRRLSQRIRADMRRGDLVAMDATRFVYGEKIVKRILEGEDYEFNLFTMS